MRGLVVWSAIALALTLGAVALLPLDPVGATPTPQQAYDLSWWTVDGGGITFAEGGDYSLGGTAGQPDAGVLAGGNYTLDGGFWKGGAAAALYRIYLPLVVRGP